MHVIMFKRFSIWYFFECCSEWIEECYRLRIFFESFKLFFPVVYPFSFSHIFLPNCFLSLSSGCWYVFVHSTLTCGWNFLSLFWNVQFCQYCLILFRYLFSLPSFVCIIWFISSSCIVCFICRVAFLFTFHFFICLIRFPCFRRFLICFSSRISHSGFEYLFVYFRGTD